MHNGHSWSMRTCVRDGIQPGRRGFFDGLTLSASDKFVLRMRLWAIAQIGKCLSNEVQSLEIFDRTHAGKH